jgi:P27 family predicted phage terminase small subunit
MMAVHSTWLPRSVSLSRNAFRQVRLLLSGGKRAPKTTDDHRGDAMQEREAKPNGLKEIGASQGQTVVETKEAKPERILDCPTELSTLARQEWDRIVGELTSLAILSSVDRGPLTAYCCAYALWIEAMEMVQKHGAMIKSPNGYPMQSPYLSHANKQFEIMMKVAVEFGFTPASRSRIYSYSLRNSMLLNAVNEPKDDSAW